MLKLFQFLKHVIDNIVSHKMSATDCRKQGILTDWVLGAVGADGIRQQGRILPVCHQCSTNYHAVHNLHSDNDDVDVWDAEVDLTVGQVLLP